MTYAKPLSIASRASLILLLFGLARLAAAEARVSPGLRDALMAGEAQRVIVLFEHSVADASAGNLRKQKRIEIEDDEIRGRRVAEYRNSKRRVLSGLNLTGIDKHIDFDHLPMAAMRLLNAKALDQLATHPDVLAVFEDTKLKLELSESLPLIHQPAAIAANIKGTGTTVAILDTGTDYRNSAFSPCTAPGVPATCPVAAALDIAPDDFSLDDNGHGTNVSAIALGVAPGSRIVSLDIFEGGFAFSSVTVAGINWALAHRSEYNIVAINMSLGESSPNATPCATDNVFRQPIIDAKAAGIVTVVASGNEGFTDGITRPACTPEAVSVGAVYDTDVGPRSWSVAGGTCNDQTTAADKVACFSNTASYLTLLAPGALITAAGSTYGGTSQAAPHVAGAVALLRSAFPSQTVDQTIATLTALGKPVTDSRPTRPLSKNRLDLAAINSLISKTIPALPLWAILGMASVLAAMLTKLNARAQS